MNLVYTFLCAAINLRMRVCGKRYSGSLSPGVLFTESDGMFQKSYRSYYSVGSNAYIELSGPGRIEYPGVVLDDGATLTIQSESAVFKSVQLLREQFGVSSANSINPPSVIFETDGDVELDVFIAEGGSKFRWGGTTGSDLHLKFVHLKGFSDFDCHACSDQNPSEIFLGRHSKVSVTKLSSQKTKKVQLHDFSKLSIRAPIYCSLGEEINMYQDTSLIVDNANEVEIQWKTLLLDESKLRLDTGSSLAAKSLLLQPKSMMELQDDAEIIAPGVDLVIAGNVQLKKRSSLVFELTNNTTCFLNGFTMKQGEKVWINDMSDDIQGVWCSGVLRNCSAMFSSTFTIVLCLLLNKITNIL